MIPGSPSGGVEKFALLTWPPSGNPLAVLAPSMRCPATASPPGPGPSRSSTWKLPAASVNPIGAASEVIVERVEEVIELDPEPAPVPLPVLRDGLVPRAEEVRRAVLRRGACRTRGGSRTSRCPVSAASTSSFGLRLSSSLTSAKTCALFPESAVPSNTGNVTAWRSPPPFGHVAARVHVHGLAGADGVGVGQVRAPQDGRRSARRRPRGPGSSDRPRSWSARRSWRLAAWGTAPASRCPPAAGRVLALRRNAGRRRAPRSSPGAGATSASLSPCTGGPVRLISRPSSSRSPSARSGTR